ncbi:MAG TPA: endo-1,4-beta-xylanase [Ignavibacteriales bacterium]|nr:endo-1,4-beta-xylanase [Ignavibacteriales bacterium]
MPEVLTRSRTGVKTLQGELIFKPYFVQKGRGPNLLDWAYASDKNWDAFHSNITAGRDGVKISDTEGVDKFGIDVRWNVEGFGYIYITADNGGEYYTLPKEGNVSDLNLNYELAKSRVYRNRRRLKKFSEENPGFKPPKDTQAFLDLSEDFLSDAGKYSSNGEKCAQFSQTALYYAMWGGEKLELSKAQNDIERRGYRQNFFIGCDARGFLQMDPDLFMEDFTNLFNYATITHYLKSNSYQDFEPNEGDMQFDLRDAVLKRLRNHNITVEGRPLFWFYETVTPDWLRKKNYDELRKYVEKHARAVVSHYGDQMYAWEVVNEIHDWANELQLNNDQIVEITRLACDVTKDTNPKVKRLINNCCPYAEYVQLKKWGNLDAKYHQRTPHQFMQNLVDAGVDFNITGQQMYFPYRDLQDTIILIERLEKFGRPVQLTEVGASSGPTKDSIFTGRLDLPKEPYVWHRPWDEELQADWLEGLYSLAYSKPWIEAVNWYDFVDPYAWIKNGGLLASPQGEKKAAYYRLKKLEEYWKSLPAKS